MIKKIRIKFGIHFKRCDDGEILAKSQLKIIFKQNAQLALLSKTSETKTKKVKSSSVKDRIDEIDFFLVTTRFQLFNRSVHGLTCATK